MFLQYKSLDRLLDRLLIYTLRMTCSEFSETPDDYIFDTVVKVRVKMAEVRQWNAISLNSFTYPQNFPTLPSLFLKQYTIHSSSAMAERPRDACYRC